MANRQLFMLFRFTTLALLALARGNLPVTAASEASIKYQVTELTGLAGETVLRSSAFAINDRGQISGAIQLDQSTWVAVLWENGVAIDLGISRTAGPVSAYVSEDGRIVGTYGVLDSDSAGVRGYAFSWDEGFVTLLDGPAGYQYSQATGVNRNGDVIGYASDGANPQVGIVWRGGTVEPLGFVNERAFYPASIANSGVIAGAVGISGGDPTAALWIDGAITLLDEPEGAISIATDHNDAGVTVGFTFTTIDQRTHPVGWVYGVLVPLESPDQFQHCDARAINDRGDIVGNARNDSGQTDVILWSGGTMTDISQSLIGGDGWTLDWTADINNLGQIVGIGMHNGEQRAFLLTPLFT